LVRSKVAGYHVGGIVGWAKKEIVAGRKWEIGRGWIKAYAMEWIMNSLKRMPSRGSVY
jgi:hypothetical protein